METIKVTYLKDGKGTTIFIHKKKVYAVLDEKGRIIWLNIEDKLWV
jgi:hypothetical protein